MTSHNDITDKDLHSALRRRQILFGGNKRLKIYGKLNCGQGKRMKKQNRVFFKNETEARSNGFRPCGHCMKNAYIKWKKNKL
jgi:methylphosphotriester-DNA--protein-cysteine methyltransferase